MENNDEKWGSARYTIKKEDIPFFIAGLRELQEGMIEAVVESKERQGFPEATAIIKAIMEKR